MIKTTINILKSIGLVVITLLIIADYNENGHADGVSMYFVVFMIPLIIVSIINGFWLHLIGSLKNEIKAKRILSLLPVLILIIIIFMEDVKIPKIDGSISLIGIAGGIAIGINNLIWNYYLKRNLEKGIINNENILDDSYNNNDSLKPEL